MRLGGRGEYLGLCPGSEQQPGRLIMRILPPLQPITLPLGCGARRCVVVSGIFVRSQRAEKRKSVQVLILESYCWFVFQKSKGWCKELLEGISGAGV